MVNSFTPFISSSLMPWYFEFALRTWSSFRTTAFTILPTWPRSAERSCCALTAAATALPAAVLRSYLLSAPMAVASSLPVNLSRALSVCAAVSAVLARSLNESLSRSPWSTSVWRDPFICLPSRPFVEAMAAFIKRTSSCETILPTACCSWSICAFAPSCGTCDGWTPCGFAASTPRRK